MGSYGILDPPVAEVRLGVRRRSSLVRALRLRPFLRLQRVSYVDGRLYLGQRDVVTEPSRAFREQSLVLLAHA